MVFRKAPDSYDFTENISTLIMLELNESGHRVGLFHVCDDEFMFLDEIKRY